jgi:hypothetical protein
MKNESIIPKECNMNKTAVTATILARVAAMPSTCKSIEDTTTCPKCLALDLCAIIHQLEDQIDICHTRKLKQETGKDNGNYNYPSTKGDL